MDKPKQPLIPSDLEPNLLRAAAGKGREVKPLNRTEPKGRPVDTTDKFIEMQEREEYHRDQVEEERRDYDYEMEQY